MELWSLQYKNTFQNNRWEGKKVWGWDWWYFLKRRRELREIVKKDAISSTRKPLLDIGCKKEIDWYIWKQRWVSIAQFVYGTFFTSFYALLKFYFNVWQNSYTGKFMLHLFLGFARKEGRILRAFTFHCLGFMSWSFRNASIPSMGVTGRSNENSTI